MKVLYIFPHPDDESFGPAAGIAKQVSMGHEVYLLTLTKGEATKQRLRLGVDKKEMGAIREREMRDVEKVLGLAELTVLDFPDSGLADLDPRELERVVFEHMARIGPEVVVTYAAHGISGFIDHLVGYAAVKRAFVEARDAGHCRRLALFTVNEEQAKRQDFFPLKHSKDEDIDCVVTCGEAEKATFIAALDCYVTYQEVIANTKEKEMFDGNIYFELFQEDFNPPLGDIFEQLP